MRIDINQKKISLGDKYRIFVDGQPAYVASAELFRLLSVINLVKNGETKPCLTIRKQWFFLKPKYQIVVPGHETTEFRAESAWKLHYRCHFSPDLYHVYGHRGRKHSVYRNDTQIAWWDKEAVTWFDGDNYTIHADRDCNAELVIAFCLILDNHRHKGHGDAMSIDFGNFFGVVKPFNERWTPRT